MIKNVNSKMTTNSQLSTTKSKKNKTKKPIKQTTRTGTESQKWRGLSAGTGRGVGGKYRE